MRDSAATLKDVARLAGVHPATASRALNVETRLLVSHQTASRVLAAAAELGYQPNAVARSLRTRRSNIIGVLIPDLTNPLFPPMVRGLADRLESLGYVALIGNTDGDDARARRVFEQMSARHVDGYVLATAHLHDALLTDATQSGVPVVLMNRVAADEDFPAVTVDNESGVRLAVRHLVALGHQDIACIAGPLDVSTGLARYRAFRSAMTDAGLDVPDDRIAFARSFSIDEGYRGAREILAARDGCTAVAAGNDMLAVGCYRALDEAGLSCPGDLSVVGFNDMPFIDMLRPPLTTVAFSHQQVGAQAADLLIERLTGATGPAKLIYVAPELVVRGSTARRSVLTPG
jgi:LacI family transcriptional regulator